MAGENKSDNRNWDRLSLFNENTWKEAGHESTTVVPNDKSLSNGHSVIKIMPNFTYYDKDRSDLEPIIGVLLKNVSFSVNSEWQEMGVPKIPSVLGVAANAMNSFDLGVLGGSGEFGAVWKSKKLWRKSGDLKINPDFRVVDWHGDGEPLRSAIQIVKYCLPGNKNSDLNSMLKKLEATAKLTTSEIAKGINSKLENAKKIATNTSSKGVIGTLQEGVSHLESVSDTIMDDIHDVYTLKDAPPPLKVQIGQFFYHPDMILESVSFDFSRELSMFGPLYVDIKLDLVSRKILNGIKDVGIAEPKNLTSRVEIQTGSSVLVDVGKDTLKRAEDIYGTVKDKVLETTNKIKRKGRI